MGKLGCPSLGICLKDNWKKKKGNSVLSHFPCSNKPHSQFRSRPSSAHLSVHSADTWGCVPGHVWRTNDGRTVAGPRPGRLTYPASDACSHRCGTVQSQLQRVGVTETNRTSKISLGLVVWSSVTSPPDRRMRRPGRQMQLEEGKPLSICLLEEKKTGLWTCS